MKNQEQKQFQGALILSTLLHLFIAGLFYFALPFVFEQLPEEKDVLTFEVVSINEITNIKTENESKQDEKLAKKSKQVKSAKPIPKEKTPPPEKPVKKEEPEKKKEIVPVKKKEKPKKTPPKKKEVQKNKEDPMDSILKNLEKESKGTEAKTPTKSHEAKKQGTKTARGSEYDEESPLSITEEIYIKRLVNSNWRRPVGLEYSEGINLKVYLKLDKTGKIIKAGVGDTTCPAHYSNLCVLLKESVLRAVKKIDTVENLSSDRYNTWKEFTFNFDSEFFNQ